MDDGLIYHQCYIADNVSPSLALGALAWVVADRVMRAQVISDVSVFFEESSQFIKLALDSGPDNAILVRDSPRCPCSLRNQPSAFPRILLSLRRRRRLTGLAAVGPSTAETAECWHLSCALRCP